MSLLETIVAPATPLGRSALAVVRMDGPSSLTILKALTRAELPPARVATRTRLYAGDNHLIDDCVAVRFVAPHSFTGNDAVEITVHGSPFLVQRVVGECVARGARIAEPGEFTERAVLNGKLDLVQAESIADLINARTELQARLSLSNLEGALSRKAVAVRTVLLDVIARFEAALDFADEGYEFISRANAHEALMGAVRDLREMDETFRRGNATTSGLQAVIVGRPNAGKSTLLNRLVGSERAIVTAIPGTTRDIVRETIEIGGLPVTFADTAGLRMSDDVVEAIGIARTREAARGAEIILYVIDSEIGVTDEDRSELATLRDPMVVYSKTDLAPAPEGFLGISVAADEGINELLRSLDHLVRERFAASEGAALVNERQRLAVAASLESLESALASLTEGQDEQLILVDLYGAAKSLGLLTGAISNNEVLAQIFGKFCIGK